MSRKYRIAVLPGDGTGPERIADDGVRRFCRDCRHYISHPFLSRCDRHDRAADPMGDCPDFTPKETDKGKDA